ncbi:hypothetical protein [Allohahella marinimesophila]|uniref:DUF4189 domain-containing protein n=1 Tax=Allohahella marinimesophila TaxID=1054972 RepID=A0ABP7P1M3_9GAMM
MMPFIRKTVLVSVGCGLLTALSMPASAANSCRVEQNINFNDHGSGYKTYTQAMAANDFGKLLTNAAGDVRGFDQRCRLSVAVCKTTAECRKPGQCLGFSVFGVANVLHPIDQMSDASVKPGRYCTPLSFPE